MLGKTRNKNRAVIGLSFSFVLGFATVAQANSPSEDIEGSSEPSVELGSENNKVENDAFEADDGYESSQISEAERNDLIELGYELGSARNSFSGTFESYSARSGNQSYPRPFISDFRVRMNPRRHDGYSQTVTWKSRFPFDTRKSGSIFLDFDSDNRVKRVVVYSEGLLIKYWVRGSYNYHSNSRAVQQRQWAHSSILSQVGNLLKNYRVPRWYAQMDPHGPQYQDLDPEKKVRICQALCSIGVGAVAGAAAGGIGAGCGAALSGPTTPVGAIIVCGSAAGSVWSVINAGLNFACQEAFCY